jgi:DNA-binding transcriptional ArsR family regulator
VEHPTWSFLTNHARVLVCVAGDPNIRLREIGATVGITERASHRIVAELVDAGYMTREREGRRNRYTVLTDRPLPDPLARGQSVGELLALLTSSALPQGAAG